MRYGTTGTKDNSTCAQSQVTDAQDNISARAWLELALVPKVSISAKLAWLREFGSPGDVIRQKVSELRRISEEARPLADIVEQETIDGVLDWAAQTGGRCLFLGDADYPSILYERLADAPLAVFARGDMALLDKSIVAIAGTPSPSRGGASRARTVALELAQEGIVVAAGISPGIASEAVRGTMTGRAGMIGVVGKQSSWEGLRIAEDVANAGLLISELAPRTPDSDHGYSRRHRLLPALADLLLVVEAPSNCDSLRLAGDAGDFGCEVAAVPSDPANDRGRGCNFLLREGAGLVEGSADVLRLVAS